MPTPEATKLADKYRVRTKEGVFFCGRLGTYKYLNMDLVIDQALKLARELP
jgi:UDP-galactopyranose mutase